MIFVPPCDVGESTVPDPPRKLLICNMFVGLVGLVGQFLTLHHFFFFRYFLLAGLETDPRDPRDPQTILKSNTYVVGLKKSDPRSTYPTFSTLHQIQLKKLSRIPTSSMSEPCLRILLTHPVFRVSDGVETCLQLSDFGTQNHARHLPRPKG